MNIPNELKYTEDHEWIRVEGDVAVVGITEFASGELGDVVFVEVETDNEYEKGETFGSIEAVKTVSDMFMPVGGEVIEFNEKLEDAPETINSDPYGEGWIAKIKMSDASEVEEMLDAEAYKAQIG
jgi:glycine cleavage system H protein